MLYPMASKKFQTGPLPGSSVPTRVMTRDPKQNIHHLKVLYASNPPGHSSKSIKYEPSYGHLNFHYSPVPLYYKQLKILKNQFLVSRSKVLFKRCFADWIASVLESVYVPSSTHMLGGHFFRVYLFFEVTNPLNLKRLQLQILLVLAREPSQYYVF